MKKLVALFDMDDTLCDTAGQRERDLRKFVKEESEVVADYLSQRCPPHVKELLRMIIAQPGWWENLPRLEDGFHLYNLAQTEGLETQILSKGPTTYPLAWTEKFKWCQKHVPESKITITLDKSQYRGDILVDDWPNYVTAWLETNPNGWAILPTRKHNQDYSNPRAIHYTGQNIEQVRTLMQTLKAQL
jgi:hypothetical protein